MNEPHGPLGFSGIIEMENGLDYLGQNSNNPPPDPRGTCNLPLVSKHYLYTGTAVETVKLNFHLEFYATLGCDLYSGLCLELQVCCNLASHEALTDTGLPWDFPAGGAYASYSMVFHEFIREHPTLIDCDV